MREWIYRRLDGMLTRLKGREYRLDRAIPLGLMIALVIRRATWLARGMVKCLVLQRRFRAVFMAPGVNLRGASLIKFGRGVTLERGVMIDALMRNGVSLGANVMIGPYSVLVGAPLFNLGEGIRMGANSAVGAYSFLGSSGPITIGENVIMGQHVSFHPENHNVERTDVPIRDQATTRLGIVVEDDVWVGANVTFLDGARVGRGSVIGAGAVVRGEIPPWSVAVGVPARVVRTRKPQDKGARA
jgi:acetyltransferase-like isoleucine patch superfamily enzyme